MLINSITLSSLNLLNRPSKLAVFLFVNFTHQSGPIKSYRDAIFVRAIFLSLVARSENVSLRGYDHHWNYYENMPTFSPLS